MIDQRKSPGGMKSGNHFNPVKVLKGVLIFALGIGVYLTERAFRSKVSFKG